MTHRAPFSADVLLITVNKHETQAVQALFGAGREVVRLTVNRFAYLDYGYVNGARVVHTISGMGVTDPGAMWDTTTRALKAFRPWAVIAVGIAWGANEDKQKIGEILVSQSLHLGGHKKLVEGVRRDRGPTPPASDALRNLFLTSQQLYWQGAAVEFGPLISEETLFDDRSAKEQALSQCLGALGGEMEGSGMYGAARNDRDWIVVKAICDWGYKKQSADKEVNQRDAARNAATFVHESMSNFSFATLRSSPSSSESTSEDDATPFPSSDHLSPEATELLVEATKDPNGRVLAVEQFDVLAIQTNGRQDFVHGADPLIQAIWEAALDELLDRNFLEAEGKQGEVFRVTKRGFEAAESLADKGHLGDPRANKP
jgi:nucleoside phosphorylase